MKTIPPAFAFAFLFSAPLIAMSLAVSLQTDSHNSLITELLVVYSVILLSFLGGINLNIVLNQKIPRKLVRALMIIESLWPALAGWALLYTAEMHIQIMTLTLLYVLTLGIDSLLYNISLIPQWFYTLRCIITPVVVLSLYISELAAVRA